MTRDYKIIFSTNVVAALGHLKKSQSWLAEQAGVKQSNLSRWIRGENEPGLEAILSIAEALGLTLDQLFSIEGARANVVEPELPSGVVKKVMLAAELAAGQAADSAIKYYQQPSEDRRRIDAILDALAPEVVYKIREMLERTHERNKADMLKMAKKRIAGAADASESEKTRQKQGK